MQTSCRSTFLLGRYFTLNTSQNNSPPTPFPVFPILSVRLKTRSHSVSTISNPSASWVNFYLQNIYWIPPFITITISPTPIQGTTISHPDCYNNLVTVSLLPLLLTTPRSPPSIQSYFFYYSDKIIIPLKPPMVSHHPWNKVQTPPFQYMQVHFDTITLENNLTMSSTPEDQDNFPPSDSSSSISLR